MEKFEINTAFAELSVEEISEVEGGGFKDFIEGLDYLNNVWDSWKQSFKNGWNKYPY